MTVKELFEILERLIADGKGEYEVDISPLSEDTEIADSISIDDDYRTIFINGEGV